MRVLFIYPDIITLHGLMNFCPPVHILSAVLKREGFKVDLIHINDEHGVKYEKETILDKCDGYDLFAVTATSFSYKYAHEIAGWLKERHPSVLRILGGCHATIMPEDFESSNFDIFCVGEGEEPLKELAIALRDGKDWTKIPNFITRYGINPVRGFLRDLDGLPYQDFEITDTKKILELRKGWLSLSFSRGCPYECLQGDTYIDTTEGFIPIKKLVGKTPMVLTRDPETNEPKYAQVSEVKLTRKNSELVRVNFDNGSFIDCTPDHKFMTFKNGNQFCNMQEKEVEACDLKKDDSVRAIHYDISKYGYVTVVWGRRKYVYHHRLVMEGIIGRKMLRNSNEQIHHIDKNKQNNKGSNLILTDKSHITLYHPEISQRMKTDNAAKNMTHEQRIGLGKMQLGKKRTLQSRINYRNSKLGTKNPQYKHGKSKYNISRINDCLQEVNHKIVSIEKLNYKEDTYCMEVPGYDWFYANGVLVHNCSFCINHLYKKVEIGENDKMSDYLRRRSPENSISELESIVSNYAVKYFNIDDDLLTVDKKWMKEFTDKYTERIFKPHGIKYILNARATTIDDELARMLSTSGCREVRIGFETGNEKLRNGLLFKKVTDKSLLKACNTLDKYNIMSVFFMMIGIPGESWDTYFETVDMTILLKPKLIRMTFLYPYVHTRIHDYCLENGLFREGEIDDNNDIASPLIFDNLTDEELFCMKFMFVWYVNARWFGGKYQRAIDSYKGLSLSKLKELIPGIIERDRLMSEKCNHSHYRYYGGNPNYFELYDYLKNTI